MFFKKTAAIVLPALALTFGASSGAQASNLVQNGSFNDVTVTVPNSTGVSQQFN
jgi:hypothetical protein